MRSTPSVRPYTVKVMPCVRKGHVGGVLAFPPQLYREPAEALVNPGVMRAMVASSVEHLVVRLPERVAREHR
jgi:hypothetical protein